MPLHSLTNRQFYFRRARRKTPALLSLGGYVGGREHRMDDDDDVNDDEFDVRNLLRRRWRIGILRGWLIIDMSGFHIPSRIVRLL